MDVVEVLNRLGGFATAQQLVELTSRARVRRACEHGEIVRLTRGSYALPTADHALSAAAALSGVVSHLSAAAYWGWAVKTPPTQPDVTVPAKRRVTADRRNGVTLHWRDLSPIDRAGPVTSPLRTVLDCARDLPFDEALAVADSALRSGRLSRDGLMTAAETAPSRGRQRCLRVARHADARAANPFESVLRALAHDVAGLDLVPQVELDLDVLRCRPDLVDRRRKVVAEAESWEFHGHRSALRKDCRRYTVLALHGWLVLRFSWEDVMFQPRFVGGCLEAAAWNRSDRRWSA